MSGDLERSRRRFEESLADLVESVGRELGTVPRLGRWALLVGAAAAGFVVGGAVATRISQRRRLRLRG